MSTPFNIVNDKNDIITFILRVLFILVVFGMVWVVLWPLAFFVDLWIPVLVWLIVIACLVVGLIG